MTNHLSPSIEELIQQANDPSDRAMLVVLNKMASSLDANTRLTEAVSTRLEEHIESFQEKVEEDNAIKHKGMGAWKILAWVLGLAQVAVGWGLVEARAEAHRMTAAITAHSALDAQLRADMVATANNSAVADLRIVARMDRIEDRCSQLETSGKK